MQHTAKCLWILSLQTLWLGFDLRCDGRKDCGLKKADEFGSVSRSRQLASVIGKIISILLAMGPISHLMTRDMYVLLSS